LGLSFKETEIGLIPKDWNLFELKDKVNITMGQSPKSKFYNSDGIGIPFMQGRKTFGSKYHTIDTWCTDPKRLAKKGDVLMSVRAPVGDVNIAINDLCIGRGLASLRMYNGNNEFLFYLLRNYVDKITSRETGTVFGSINKKGIETLKLPFPSNSEQKAIANILSTLDEKIEVNNKINKTLEKMAQTIFKHWFVDFEFPNENGEPYKSSGGEMTHSELGMIPKGWKVRTIKEIALNGNVICGKTPSTKKKKIMEDICRLLQYQICIIRCLLQ
jgi:type I restriction enzyme S subunit